MLGSAHITIYETSLKPLIHLLVSALQPYNPWLLSLPRGKANLDLYSKCTTARHGLWNRPSYAMLQLRLVISGSIRVLSLYQN